MSPVLKRQQFSNALISPLNSQYFPHGGNFPPVKNPCYRLCKLIIKRLGKARDDGKPRPVLVTMPDEESCTSALKQAPSLKNADNNFAGIRVKKDVHPAIRREWARMFRSEEIEREKPENQGCKIEFDRRKRQILKDGEVIDTFQAHF